MASLRSLRAACGLSVLLTCSSWGNIIQTQDFDYTLSGQQDGSYLVENGFFMNNVAPFDPSQGQLTGFTVDWEMTFNISGITETMGGALVGSMGGTYAMGGVGYFGYGDGNDATSLTAGAPLSLPPLLADVSESFAVPDNPELYNPALLAVVTGISDFTVEWDSPFNISIYNMASWTAEASGSVTVTYDYVPEPSGFVPMLGGLGVFALVGRRLRRR
jgi:hypothetical protein